MGNGLRQYVNFMVFENQGTNGKSMDVYFLLNLLIYLFQVCHALHRARRPHLPAQLPAQHGLRDVGEPRPHLGHRLHQGPDEQLPGPRARPGTPTEHQHHLPEPADREHQDQGGRAGDSRGGVPGA